MNKKDSLNLAQWAMEQALRCGAHQTDVTLSWVRSVVIAVRERKLDQVKESTQSALSLILYVDSRYSTQNTNDLRKDSLKDFIAEAVASTKYLSPDKYRSLPDPKFYPKNFNLNIQANDVSHEKIEPAERVKMAMDIEAAAMAESNQIISTTAEYSDSHYQEYKINNNGFKGERESTGFSAGAEVTVKDGEKGRPSDWYYASVRYRSDLPAPGILGKEAVQRALQKIGQKKIESGRYEMVVENRVSSRLLTMLQAAMTARSLQQKRSFLDGMLGKKITDEKLTVTDDPFILKGIGSRIYDGEGLATSKRIMIEKGILKQYFVDNYYGKKIGMEPNSGAASNILIENGSRSLAEMIKDVNHGIVVTSFIGGNSNGTTGDFSLGIVGYLVDKGEVIHPVNEMNISGNNKEFWNQLVELGNDPYPYSSWQIPSLSFKDVQFSGI
jgi:PmbA protein